MKKVCIIIIFNLKLIYLLFFLDATLENKPTLSLGAVPKTEKEEEKEKNIDQSDEFEVQIKRRSIVTPQLLDLDDEDDSKYKIINLKGYYLIFY